MKKLYILRHGKSSWDMEVNDYDRPLKKKGIDDAYKLSLKLLNDNYPLPDCIVSSSAIRAVHTGLILCKVLKYRLDDFFIVERLYETSPEKLVQFLRKTNDKFNSMMIIGHNPTFTEVANYYLSESIDNIPTCGLIVLTFNVESWEKIEKHKVKDSKFYFFEE